MPFLCRLGWHKAAQSDLWNNGYFFSQCTRCGGEMVKRRGGRWHAIPKGQQVVWKPRGEADIDWSAWSRAHNLNDDGFG